MDICVCKFIAEWANRMWLIWQKTVGSKTFEQCALSKFPPFLRFSSPLCASWLPGDGFPLPCPPPQWSCPESSKDESQNKSFFLLNYFSELFFQVTAYKYNIQRRRRIYNNLMSGKFNQLSNIVHLMRVGHCLNSSKPCPLYFILSYRKLF